MYISHAIELALDLAMDNMMSGGRGRWGWVFFSIEYERFGSCGWWISAFGRCLEGKGNRRVMVCASYSYIMIDLCQIASTLGNPSTLQYFPSVPLYLRLPSGVL